MTDRPCKTARRAKKVRSDSKLGVPVRHPEYSRRMHLRRRYGITQEQYLERLAEQGGKCGICGRPPKNQRLHVDHDHKTGSLRGLLCCLCNRHLSWIENDGWDKLAHSYLKSQNWRT